MFDEDSLPGWRDHARKLWRLELIRRLPGSTCSEVWEVELPGAAPAVLKLPFDPEEAGSGRAWLAACQGLGAARLLDSDPATGAMLLEKLPGPTLDALDHEDQCRIFCGLAGACFTGDPWPGAAGAETWYEDAIGEGRLPREVVEASEQLLARLFETTKDRVFVHGDLHHFNVLGDGSGGWKAIDPKGLMADPAYEAAAFLRNPIDVMARGAGQKELMEDRVHRLSSALDLDPWRVWGWGFAVTTRCAHEGNGEFERAWVNAALALHQLSGRWG